MRLSSPDVSDFCGTPFSRDICHSHAGPYTPARSSVSNRPLSSNSFSSPAWYPSRDRSPSPARSSSLLVPPPVRHSLCKPPGSPATTQSRHKSAILRTIFFPEDIYLRTRLLNGTFRRITTDVKHPTIAHSDGDIFGIWNNGILYGLYNKNKYRVILNLQERNTRRPERNELDGFPASCKFDLSTVAMSVAVEREIREMRFKAESSRLFS